jgi:autotransporter-associated beta strand protein
VLTFTGAGGTATNDVSGTVNVGGLNFAPGAGAYTLAGSSFTLAPDANIRNLSTNAQTISANIVLAGDQWVQADPGSSLSISGGISGAAALRKLGSGTLTLSGSNSYSGGTTVSAGILAVASAAALPTSGTVSVATGSQLRIAGNQTFNAPLTLAGEFTNVTGVLVNASGTNTWSGPISIATPTTRIESAAGTLTISGTVTTSGSGNVVFLGDGTTIIAGRVTGSMQPFRSSGGTGIVTLTNPANDFTGGLGIGGNATGATLRLGASEVIPHGAAAENIRFTGGSSASFGILDLGGFSETINGLEDASAGGGIIDNLVGGSSTLTIGANDTTSTFRGLIRNTQGQVAIVKSGAGVLTLSGSNSYTGGTTISGGRLQIAPAGRLAASGAITINGATADLRYNASTPLTAPLTFTQGMISGTGTIGTAVTVAAGRILAPGNSPGAQAYTSGLTWSPGGSYQWEINDATGTVGTNWDVLNVSGGALDLAGLSSASRFNLDLITLSGTASGLMANFVDGQSYSFAIATYSSLLLPDGFSGSDLTSLFQLNTSGWLNPLPAPGNFSVVNNAGTNTINLVIVPEPAGLALAGLGIAAAAWASRRRRP